MGKIWEGRSQRRIYSSWEDFVDVTSHLRSGGSDNGPSGKWLNENLMKSTEDYVVRIALFRRSMSGGFNLAWVMLCKLESSPPWPSCARTSSMAPDDFSLPQYKINRLSMLEWGGHVYAWLAQMSAL